MLALPAGAFAQSPPPAGLAADGSLTVDGVTYSAEELAAMVEVYRIDPAALQADLPGEVRAAVYSLSAATPLPVPTPAPGGAP